MNEEPAIPGHGPEMPAPPSPMSPAKSSRHFSLLWMVVLVALVALVATHRFWWTTLSPYLAQVSRQQIPGANPPPPPPSQNAMQEPADDDTMPPAGFAPAEGQAAPVEQGAAQAQAPVTPGPTATDFQNLRRDVQDLQQRPAFDPQSIKVLTDQLQQLSDRVKGVEARLDVKESQIRDERALTLAAGQIIQAMSNSTPYDAPLAVIRSIAADDPTITGPLDILDKTAKAGLPSRWSLSQSLEQAGDQIAKPAEPASGGDFWDRTLDRVSGLVTIRRERDADHPNESPSSETLIATAQKALIAGDLDAAVKQIQQIQGKDAETVKPWLDQAASRQDAEGAALALESALTQRLAASGQGQH